MSTTIDQRVVEMRFDNKQFESGIQTSLSTLDKLKRGLNLSSAAKGLENLGTAAKNVSLSGLSGAVETVHAKFSALEVMGVTALANITNSAVNAGKQMISALTLDPIMTGFEEYETKINAIQTILTNTASKGTTLDDVNKTLAELNEYADQTIYNFAEMTRNIGTFTAAGVSLEDASVAIKGIANLAAGSGSTSQQASNAMYQLSQALASGMVGLQDWNSVVNAGMGGEYFQKALKETAKQMGVVVDESVSFRDSMNKSAGGSPWITSEILLETLKKFADDETLVAAATQVKTFTQLFDTMKESVQSGWSVSWEHIIGDKEEATTTLTAISNAFNELIGPSTEARNQMLQFWHDNGGRDALIEAITNAFHGLQSVLDPVSQAFEKVFPAMTGEKLTTLTKGVRDLTENFKISDTTADNIRRTFEGLFSLVDIGVNGVSALVRAFGSFVGYVAPAGDGLLAFTANIGDYLVGLNATIEKNDIFNKAFQDFGAFITPIADKVKQGFSTIADAFKEFVNVDTSGLDSLSERVSVRFEPLTALGKALKAIIGGIAATVEAVAPTFFNLASAVGEALGNLSNTVANGLRNFNFNTIFDVINGGLFAGIALGIKKFIDSLGEAVEKGGNFFENFVDIFDGIKGCLEEYQKSLKADTLIKIASAIGILAAALVALSLIDSAKLTSAISAMSVMFAELVVSFGLLDKISGGGTFGSIIKISTVMVTLSTSMLILSAAVANLSRLDWDGLTKGLSGVGILCAELALFLNNTNLDGISLGKGVGLMALAGAIVILSGAVGKFAELNVTELVTGLSAVAVVLTELAIFTKATGDAKSVISTATGMTILGAAMLIFAEAVGKMGGLSWDEIGKGLLTMAGSLTAVTVALNFMPTNMISTGTGLVAVATSLVILAQALQNMGTMTWDEIGKSLVTLAGSLTVITIAVNGMTTALPGAAAMLVVAAALAIFTPVLLTLASMSLGEIGTGLLALAGVFGVVGVAGLALAPLTPAILALSAAIALFGVGCVAVGAGVLAFSAGLTALATAGTAGAAALVVIVTSLIGLIPMMITQIAQGIISFANVITEGAPAIVEAIKAVATAMIQMMVEITPNLVTAVLTLLTSLLTTMVEYVPQIVEAGMKLIAGFLEGVANNIQSVIDSAVNVVVNFINGISSKLPDLIQAGFDLIIDFINGLADAIEQNTPTLITAIGNLAGSMIEGLVDGLFAGVTSVVEAAKDVGNSILEGIKGILDINSPSKEMESIGEYTTDGLVKGMGNKSRSTLSTVEQFGQNILNQFKMGLSADKFATISTDICNGLIRGLNNNKPMVLNTVTQMINSILLTFRNRYFEFPIVGQEIVAKLNAGITSSKQSLLLNVTRLITNVLQVIRDKYSDFTRAGSDIMASLISGIKLKNSNVTKAFTSALSSALSSIREKRTSFYSAGEYLIDGFIDGIEDNIRRAARAAARMAAEALEAAEDELDINSPSKETYRIGSYFGMGFVKAVGDYSDKVYNAGKGMAASAQSGLTEAISKIAEIIDSDIDTQPTIRPVLDLSNVESGTRTLSTLFGRTQALNISSGINRTNGVEIQNGATTAPAGNVYTFTQNNYSPKALSRVEIYRQTKNQFSTLKGLVEA